MLHGKGILKEIKILEVIELVIIKEF